MSQTFIPVERSLPKELIHTVHNCAMICGYPVDNMDNLSQTSGKLRNIHLKAVDNPVESVDEGHGNPEDISTAATA